MFVVFSTDKKELVSKNFARPSSGFVYLLIAGVPKWERGVPGGVGSEGELSSGKDFTLVKRQPNAG